MQVEDRTKFQFYRDVAYFIELFYGQDGQLFFRRSYYKTSRRCFLLALKVSLISFPRPVTSILYMAWANPVI